LLTPYTVKSYLALPECASCGCPFDEGEVALIDAAGNIYCSASCAEEVEPDAEPDGPPEDMDGDHTSALASAGWGTDEDYGYYGGDDF
jgi:hypothetical protein